ncbi:sensor histidine kinase [Salipiger aestuarii]|uniref:sensor histidine kinase n=1 Tax=Salipiger aestuarii TaxID=568098 RepID=UPI00123B56F9|nr:ATP-binding protein [Salipiger aestuarii]
MIQFAAAENQPARAFRNALKRRVMTISAIVSGACALCIGMLGLLLVLRMEFSKQEAIFLDELTSIEETLSRGVRAVLSDLTFLGNVLKTSADPPIGNGPDVARWRRAAEHVFSAMLAERSFYGSIRILDPATGNELARVERRGGEVSSVSQDKYENRISDSWFAPSRQTGAGQFYIATGTVSHSGNTIEEPRTAVLHYSAPIFGNSGLRTGMLVIDVNTDAYGAHMLRRHSGGYTLVSHDSEASFVYDMKTGTGKTWIGEPPPLPDPVLGILDARQDHASVQRVGGYLIASRILPSLRLSGELVGTVLFVETRHILANAMDASLILALVLLGTNGITMVLAKRSVTRILRPFQSIDTEIELARKEARGLALPRQRRDELGQVSRSLGRLVNDLVVRENQAMTLFDGVSESMLLCGPDGRIRAANLPASKLLGIGRDALKGRVISGFLANLDHADAWFQTLYRNSVSGVGQMHEARLRCSDGSEVPVDMTLSTITSNGEHAIVVLMRDVSALHKEQQTRKEMIEALERSNRELDDFAYVASHDLKAPLRSIMQITDWISEDLEAGDTHEVKGHLTALQGRAARMSRLLEDLLEHARIGRKPLDGAERVVSGRTMRGAIEEMIHLRDGISLTFDAGFDALKMKQMPIQVVLTNIIGNAAKHHDKPQGTIHVGFRQTGRKTLFRVTDDGPGIKPEYHKRIFGMFQTLRPRDKIEGSGMGLCIAAKHVSFLQQEIGVDSTGDGTGCVFWFTWPDLEADGHV